MADNLVYEGEVIPVVESALTHPTRSPDLVASGDAVLVGTLTGVAINSASADTATIEVAVEGVWALPAAAVNATADSAIAVGDKLYYSTAETKATGTLSSDATAPSDGDEVTIGAITYTFKTALTTDPETVPYEVLIDSTAAAALDNLKIAINAGAGIGTKYSTGTEAHPTVEATTNTNTTQVVQALLAGAAGNDIATTEDSDHLAWGATSLFGAKPKGDLTKKSTDTLVGTAVSALAAGDFGTVYVKLK